jgi:uncharacterized protein (PEP-CTERM system associated)
LNQVATTGMDTVRRNLSQVRWRLSVPALAFLFSTAVQGQTTSPSDIAPVDPFANAPTPEELEKRRKAGVVTTGVRSAISYSTNVNLEDEGRPNKGGQFVLEVTPYMRAEADMARLKYKLSYSIANLVNLSNGQRILGRQRLESAATAALAGDWLWIDGSGTIANTYADLFGPLSADPNVAFVNSAQIRTFSLSPYVKTRFGGIADGTFRYGLQWTSTSANAVEQSRLNHTFSGDVRGANVDGQNWNWSWSGEHTIRKFGNSDIKRNFGIGSAYFVPTPALRLTGSVLYDQIDGLTARNGAKKGTGGGFGIEWNPADSTQLAVKSSQRYYGNSSRVTLSHVSRFLFASLDFSKGATGSLDSSVFSIDPGSVFGDSAVVSSPLYRNFITQNLRLGYGIPFGAGLIDDTFILEKKLGTAFGLIGIRNTLTFNLSYSQRDTSLFITAVPSGSSGPRGGGVGVSGRFNGLIEFSTASLDYRLKLDGRSTINGTLSVLKSEAPTSGFSSRSTTLSAGIQTRINADTQAGAGVRRSEGKTNGLTSTVFEENAIFGTVDIRF